MWVNNFYVVTVLLLFHAVYSETQVQLVGASEKNWQRKVRENESPLLFFDDFFRSPPLTAPGSPRMSMQ